MIFVLRTKILKKREKTTVIKNSKKDDLREKKQRCARTLYPWQPHMHVCLFLLCSAVSQVHAHRPKQT